jgi:alkyl hydroperoxide reductase subunit AhpF
MEQRLLEFLEMECAQSGVPFGHSLTRLVLGLLDALPHHLDDDEHVKVLEHIRSYTALELAQIKCSTLH